MSKPILQLQNGANWSSLWSYSVAAVSIPDKPGFTAPIAPILVPFLLENHIIAISATSPTAKPRWKFAGNIAKKISTGIVTGGTPDTTISDSRPLFLNRINLFRFTPYTTTYALEIAPPYWLTQLDLILWIYSGVDSDTATEQLNRIELAIDRGGL